MYCFFCTNNEDSFYKCLLMKSMNDDSLCQMIWLLTFIILF